MIIGWQVISPVILYLIDINQWPSAWFHPINRGWLIIYFKL